MNEQERRNARRKLCEQFAAEVDTWPAEKLRRCYAQPEAVAKAEKREAAEAQSGLAIQAILAFAPLPPLYWELRLAVRSHRWAHTIELWQCCSDHDDGTCDEKPFLVFSVSGMTLPDALKNAAELAAKVET